MYSKERVRCDLGRLKNRLLIKNLASTTGRQRRGPGQDGGREDWGHPSGRRQLRQGLQGRQVSLHFHQGVPLPGLDRGHLEEGTECRRIAAEDESSLLS